MVLFPCVPVFSFGLLAWCFADLSSVFALDTITLSTHVQRRPGVLLCALGPLVQGTEYLVKTFVINQK